MLVLQRKENEEIVIGNNEITIVVVSIKADKVRLGITAPKDTTVHRREIFEKIKAQTAEETG